MESPAFSLKPLNELNRDLSPTAKDARYQPLTLRPVYVSPHAWRDPESRPTISDPAAYNRSALLALLRGTARTPNRYLRDRKNKHAFGMDVRLEPWNRGSRLPSSFFAALRYHRLHMQDDSRRVLPDKVSSVFPVRFSIGRARCKFRQYPHVPSVCRR